MPVLNRVHPCLFLNLCRGGVVLMFLVCVVTIVLRYGFFYEKYVFVVVFGLLWILVFLLWAVEGNWSGKSRTHPRLYSYNPCDGLTRACLAGGGATFVLCI